MLNGSYDQGDEDAETIDPRARRTCATPAPEQGIEHGNNQAELGQQLLSNSPGRLWQDKEEALRQHSWEIELIRFADDDKAPKSSA